jgi:hypothetical protein
MGLTRKGCPIGDLDLSNDIRPGATKNYYVREGEYLIKSGGSGIILQY